MNDYSHALMKEVAAQINGYVPSYVWGKIAKAGKHKAPRQNYYSIMYSKDPSHLQHNDDAVKHVKEVAQKFIDNIPKKSHVKKEHLNVT